MLFRRNFWKSVPEQPVRQADTWDANSNRHKSISESLIKEVPVIEVDGTTAMCDGGGGATGHPVEYIQLNLTDRSKPQTCKYCGLRFVQKAH